MTSISHAMIYFPELMLALRQTLYMIGVSMMIGSLLGLIIGTSLFLCRGKETWQKKLVYHLTSSYVNIIRSFPFLLLVVMLIPLTRIIVGTGFGPKSASVSLSLVAIAIFARLCEQVLLDIPNSVLVLSDSLGVSLWQKVIHFLWLEARSGLVLSATSMLISLVSYSTVMGVVGGGGIGDFAIRYGYQRYEYTVMMMAIVMMIVLVGLIQLVGYKIAKKLDKRTLS
ncbi:MULTISPECIES: methionine ABC transporter permease [Enterococcaceae]|uniref:methionine ABC transporter permease n=1 Tax=Enterococcaceae TaxID=81852 RepID=UPI000E48C9EE|nr:MULTISPECIES: ABC transporter permease subunit [Enterococcaceae]MCI0130513.1 ABC transporter permease subunit [Vagococcus sp. CY53-2]RGI32235.1 ABC transporter permease subunit [Melissococcus sp. OM08-11BH]UNM89944.1 ABC transporter permease subunit [Vagococcus sp. CY52-2]